MIARYVKLKKEPSTASSTIDSGDATSTCSESSYDGFWTFDPIPRRCQRCRMFRIIEGDKPEYKCLKKKDYETCRKSYKLK